MSRVTLAPSLLLAAATLSACAPTPVDVDVAFPSRETFLYSAQGRLLVYEVDVAAPDDACAVILQDVLAGRFRDPVLDSDYMDVCALRAGSVRFDDVPPGPHAYVVLTRDASNTTLLSGCRVAEAYEGAPAVRVTMFPTSGYHDATDGRELACEDEERKCTQGC